MSQIVCLLFSLSTLSIFWFPSAQATPGLHYQVNPQAITKNVPRLGLNLGEWTAWGASQFPANVLKNPGFEGIIDRAIVIVKTADGRGFTDDTAWTKRPDGFWAGASYDVRSGAGTGVQGVIFDSKATGQQGLPEFIAAGKTPALKPGDVVSLTRINDQDLPSQWWFGKGLLPGQLSISADKRPHSHGLRSLALKPEAGKPVEVLSYLDSIGDRAGKLLPVNGVWKLVFWLKQNASGAKISVGFRRLNGGQPFFEETFQPIDKWQKIEREFIAQDTGAAAALALSFRAEGSHGQILLDDIELGASSKTTASAFRPELVAALKKLRPGYLRDWQGQLGDTFDNRIADPFARRATRYRPGAESTFSYGLQDFLQLAHDVDAQPWLVVPPTMGDDELQKLGRYLSGQIDTFHFKDLLVEFGNENWNPVFRPAGIPTYQAHGEAATRAFQQLLMGAKHHPILHTVVNGQYVNPWLSAKYLAGVGNAQALAVAPYFLFKLDDTDKVLEKLFEQDDFFRETLAATQAQGKDLLVYETNLHTTGGNAPATERDIATTSAAAGAALAKRLLTALNLGITKQCLYTLAQYDAFVESQGNQRGLAKLWGIVRDLGGTQRLRPAGLAMAMLNQVLPADVHPVKSLDANDNAITLTALHTPKGWALAAVSAKSEAQKITVQFPVQARKQVWRVWRLDSPSPAADNEAQENVRIVEGRFGASGDRVSLMVPAYGLVVLMGDEGRGVANNVPTRTIKVRPKGDLITK